MQLVKTYIYTCAYIMRITDTLVHLDAILDIQVIQYRDYA